MGSTPFRAEEPTEAELKQAFYSDHDLRDMYSRENTERRRAGGHTLRKYLTAKQDKKLTAQFVKIRSEYEVNNNNDAVVVFVNGLIAAGQEDEVDEKLLAVVKKSSVTKREAPLEA